jgi:hypothetical protein
MHEVRSGWGGRRPGSGRPKGSKNKRSKASFARYREIAAEARDLNMTPLAYMLAIVRDPTAEPARRDEMAWRSAVFCHPRLSTHHARYDLSVTSDVYVEQIHIVPVESGRFLTKAEIEEPLVVEVPSDGPAFLALEDASEPEPKTEEPPPEGPVDVG